MPLGKISKSQIAKGFEVLDELEAAVGGKSKAKAAPTLSELSSKFYTVIPHSFGRSVPPVINNLDMINKKKDMLLVSYRSEAFLCLRVNDSFTFFLTVLYLIVLLSMASVGSIPLMTFQRARIHSLPAVVIGSWHRTKLKSQDIMKGNISFAMFAVNVI